MTGTAAGAGAFQSPKKFLNDGDTIEVEVDGIGILRNTVSFEK
jgi:2-keto-4-pentenoate hydratase/2-oxohepta-3-ene-1,7-dioic acid hydratase in catechol pathway